MKTKKAFVFGLVVVFGLSLFGLQADAKVLKLNLAKYHFGAQSYNSPSMPSNLEMVRPTWIFNWDVIENEKGVFDWTDADKEVKKIQKKKRKILGVILPYATWDQKARKNYKKCKSIYPEAKKWGLTYVCNPVDWTAYENFLKKIVDRYDGDGKNDMPNLKIPVRMWEIANEPEFQKYYYKGTASEYAKLLKNSYETIKAEDKKAKVINGGMAGMTPDIDFWQKVFAKKNGRKLDAISYHCITCSSETASIKEFNEWRAGMKVANKRVWLTEWQIADFNSPMTDVETALTLVKGAAYAFANGVDKIFMVEFDYLSDYTLSKLALSNLISKLKYFEEVRINTEIIGDDGKINVGVYEFEMPDNDTILIAWGSGTLTIGGTIILATDIYGNAVAIENNIANLGEMPIFIETR